MPDGGYFRTRPGVLYVPTAVVVVEVLSPGDETFRKLDFYAAHGVLELLVAFPDECVVRCYDLTDQSRDGVAGEVLRPGSSAVHALA